MKKIRIKLAATACLLAISMFAHAACDQWDIAYRTTAGSGHIDCGPVSSLTDEPAPASGDLLACVLATGELRKCDVGNLPFVSFSTSAELATILSDETGSGAAVFASSPSLTTPDLGTPSTIVLSNASLLTLSALDNQGTTTTVLHGNAAGTPSFEPVDLANDVTGTLPATRGGTGQTSLGAVDVADLGCGAAGGTYVPQCDGAGGVSWAAAGSEVNNLETITTGIAADEVPIGTDADIVTYTPMPASGTDGCSGTYDKLVWVASTHSYACAVDAGAGGGMTSWTLAGDTGGGQTITDGNTASIVGDGSGIDTADSATDTLTISYDAAEAESANEAVIDLPDLQGTLTVAKGGTGQTSLGAVDAGDLGCGAAPADYALTCDGSGNAGWEAQSGGGSTFTFTAKQEIDRITLSAAGTFDFTSIPSGYDRLIIEGKLRSTTSANSDGVTVFYNSDDTASNYHSRVIFAQDGGAISSDETPDSSYLISIVSGSTSPSDFYSSVKVMIEGYDSTSFGKIASSVGTTYRTDDNISLRYAGLVWDTTNAAITEIEIMVDGYPTDKFDAGSYLILYGEKEVTVSAP